MNASRTLACFFLVGCGTPTRLPDAAVVAELDAGAPRVTFASADDARIALNTLEVPYLVAFSLAPSADLPVACPRATRTTDGWFFDGDCTNAQGVRYEGRSVVKQTVVAGGVDYAFTYEAFTATAADWSLRADGTATAAMRASSCGAPGPAPLETADLRLTISGEAIEGFGGFFPGAGRSVALRYSNYRYTWDLQCIGGAFTVSGQIALDDRGTFELDTAWHEVESCTARDDLEGTLRFIGVNTLTVRHDGSTACDGCAPWETSDGQTGQACWR